MNTTFARKSTNHIGTDLTTCAVNTASITAGRDASTKICKSTAWSLKSRGCRCRLCAPESLPSAICSTAMPLLPFPYRLRRLQYDLCLKLLKTQQVSITSSTHATHLCVVSRATSTDKIVLFPLYNPSLSLSFGCPCNNLAASALVLVIQENAPWCSCTQSHPRGSRHGSEDKQSTSAIGKDCCRLEREPRGGKQLP